MMKFRKSVSYMCDFFIGDDFGMFVMRLKVVLLWYWCLKFDLVFSSSMLFVCSFMLCMFVDNWLFWWWMVSIIVLYLLWKCFFWIVNFISEFLEVRDVCNLIKLFIKKLYFIYLKNGLNNGKENLGFIYFIIFMSWW